MTPIGHLSVSYISGKSIRNISLPAILIGGVMPDIDFLFIFFDWFNKYHHVITHNVLFITLAALFGSFFTSRGQRKLVVLSLFLGAFLHLLVDSCMDNNPTNGIGVALLWPFYGELFSPFNILSASGNKTGWSEPIKMIKPMLSVMLYEFPFYVISVFLILRRKRLSHL
jgi:membrane-bound metal-dependent hydrolase YbcI (DUF457 family)